LFLEENVTAVLSSGESVIKVKEVPVIPRVSLIKPVPAVSVIPSSQTEHFVVSASSLRVEGFDGVVVATVNSVSIGNGQVSVKLGKEGHTIPPAPISLSSRP
jgi:hypothetical protein